LEALLQVYPAYGRSYATADAMVADFVAGKDFSCSMQGGPYISVRDFPKPYFGCFKGVLLVQIRPTRLEHAVLKLEIPKDGHAH
jgi:hypothetical protein